MKTGAAVEEYPLFSRPWPEGESPGNLLMTGDRLIVAGASRVNVYADLTAEIGKLDLAIAAAPASPEPLLRYADVMDIAGRGDDAVSRLNEALKLMHGQAAGAASDADEVRDRFFNDAMQFAIVRARAGVGRIVDPELAAKFFDLAGQTAFTPRQQAEYLLARAEFDVANKDPAAALALYQQILATRQIRGVSLPNSPSAQFPANLAADAAKKAIDDIIRTSGPGIYAECQKAAETAMADARKISGRPEQMAVLLLEIARRYPNSDVAQQAMLEAAAAYESATKPRQAIPVLRQLWFKPGFLDSTQARIAEALARNYLVLPGVSQADRGRMAAARLASVPGTSTLSREMKLPDGRVVPAGTTFAKALDQVRRIRSNDAEKALPDFRLPRPPTVQQRMAGAPFTAPFLGQDPKHRNVIPPDAATVLPGVSVLLVPAGDGTRFDRIVAWGAGSVVIFSAGDAKPLFSVKAFPAAGHGNADAPRGVAWSGDTALVWGPSRLIAVDASAAGNGKVAWDLDLSKLDALEVVRPGKDQPVPTSGDPLIIRRNSRRVSYNGAADGAQVGLTPGTRNANPASQPSADAGEQVAEALPVGDRVLISTSTGRLLSAEVATGKIAWQIRLAEGPIDRLLATEDFTVAKVSDAGTCRLFALDTYTGRVLGTKPFDLQNMQDAHAPLPINLALSVEGILVYTLPNAMCFKDLYKPWEEHEKVFEGPFPQAIYSGATWPGQLIVSQGRVLAVGDNAPVQPLTGQKWVRVYALDSGEPLSLRYNAADGSHRIIDRVMTADTKEWDVLLCVVGSRVYVIGPNSVSGYNLDNPSEAWRGPTLSDGPEAGNNPRAVFCGKEQLVVLDEPTGAPTTANGDLTQMCLLPYSRRPARENDPNSAESGLLQYAPILTDPAGIQPIWQACDGGFCYATDDGKVHMLRGANE